MNQFAKSVGSRKEKLMTKMLKWAIFYAQHLEWSIIPINPKNKKPLIPWKAHNVHRATLDDITAWWTKWPDANIGLVCGAVSGISVIDIDEHEIPRTVDYMQEVYNQIMPNDPNPPWNNCYSSKTANGGYHWLFKYNPELVSRRAIPAVDVKSDGGYVIIPPSEISGKVYNWIRKPWAKDSSGEIVIRPTVLFPVMYADIFCKNPTHGIGETVKNPCNASGAVTHLTAGNKDVSQALQEEKNDERYKNVTGKPPAVTTVTFEQGGRDESLFHIANTLFRGGMAEGNIEEVIDKLGRMVCDPPFPDAYQKFKSAKDRNDERDRSLTDLIEEWVFYSHGTFTNMELDRELGINSKQEKNHRRVTIHRMRKAGKIEFANGKSGQYRRVVDEKPPIDFVNVELDYTYDNFKFPLNVDKWFRLMPRNIVIVSGAPDAGKTAFMLALAELNMDEFDVQYLSSEMGALEFRTRLDAFGWRTIDEWNFQAYERDSDFADAINPDGINIIDFLEMHDNFYQIGGYIKDIYNKLKTGVAIIAIQKNPGNENPLGGQRAREKARLVLNLDRVVVDEIDGHKIYGNVAKITKAKNWKTQTNPTGLRQFFDLYDGCQFKPRGEWEKRE
jgi:hypothetical protein